MLVCSVSLRPKLIVAAITAEAGAAAASDVVQMPGLGQLVSEQLTAADSLSATFVTGPLIIVEGANAGATAVVPGPVAAAMVQAATATSTQSATVGGGGTARQSMVGTVIVNSDGTARQANADGTMINL